MKHTSMKTRFGVLALSLLVLLGLLAAPAGALEPSQVTVELRPSVKILVDGAERTFYDATGKEVHAIYYNGTHYLPVRAIGELMGKNVNWDGTTRTITLSSPRTTAATSGTPDTAARDTAITVEQRPDISIVVDGVTRTFTDAAGNPVYVLLSSGTNYLPVRAVGELMGKTVGWNSQTRTITLSGSGSEPVVTDADTFGTAGGGDVKPGTTSLIGDEAAKTAALTHAKLAATQVTFIKCELDRDDGRQIYEVEFRTANRKYEYEIDAYTGAVLDAGYEVDRSSTGIGSDYIDRTRAMSIALGCVHGASTSHVQAVDLDRDDGEYEVEIIYNNYAYAFEIDACTGAILKQECKHHQSQSHQSHHRGHHW